ncbi:MAG: N-acetyl-1-D-myo-inositol-2-amino-2-deoxy-alpha-D -glucopyranoside deacetylase [Anaerolineae bacterium]
MPAESLHHVLGIFAHPDDETIMLGGTLAMLHARHVQTHLTLATRGEGGELGEPPVVPDRALLGAVREQELRCATARLGVTSLHLLGYIDPEVGLENTLRPFDADFEELVTRISTIIGEVRADVVLAHGPDGEYGHPAHQLIYRAVRAAVESHAPHVPFYSVAANVPGIEDHLWNTSRTAHLALDISPWAAAKIAAMECHRTQHALFKRRRKLAHVRDALRRTESFYREWPATNGRPPDDAFAALLRDCGAYRPAP